tara:strand:+ start:496 stop:801 length:306 start_codon:yes stop_codon:yes gene_type:complete
MINIKNISNQSVITTLNVNEEHTKLIHNELNDTEDTVEGVIEPDKLNESIASYTVSVPSGSRFKAEPTLSISTGDYITKSINNSDDNGNIISKTFNIFKKV